MSNHSYGNRVADHDATRLFGELKRISVEQLGAVPGGLFAIVEAHLQDALRAATENGDGIGGVQREDLMLLLLLRQRSAIHVMRYREQVGRMFDEFSGMTIATDAASPLDLVSDGELHFGIAGDRMADNISRLFEMPLHILGKRLEVLAGALGTPPSANPVGPSRLGEAFVIAFRDAEMSDTLQQLLMHQYERQLAKVLGDLYDRLNTELSKAGYEGARQQGARQESVKPEPAEREPASGSEKEAAAAKNHDGDAPLRPRADTHATGAAAGFQMQGRQGGQAPAGQSHATPTSKGVDLFRVSPQARVNHQHLRDMLHTWRDGNGAQLRPATTNDAPVPSSGHGQARNYQGDGSAHAASAQQDGLRDGMQDDMHENPGTLSSQWAGHGNPSAQGDARRRELRVDELVSVVSLLQSDVYEPFEHAFANKRPLHEAIREHLQDGARRLGLDPGKTSVAQNDADSIDLVGLLFDALLGTHALVGDARRLFARLVMTYVRIALTDENLFVRPGHPAKRLLDAIALSCESNDGASPQDRELMERAEHMVERVVTEYNEDLAIIELAATELQNMLQQQRRRAEVVERRSAETVHGRERLLQARLQAASALSQRISGRTLTPTIARFLERYWQHHYVQALLRAGHGSGQAIRACAIADGLLALDVAAGEGLGGEVADRLTALQPGLNKCLGSSGLDETATNELIAGIARAVAFPDAARQTRPTPPTPQLNDDSDDTRLLRVVGGNSTLEFDPRVAERMRKLQPGDWLRLVEESGVEGSVKVAWISPLTSRMLLVNRRGIRKLVASPEQLAALAKLQRLLVDADELPFDQAMRQVRERLSNEVALAG